MIESYTMDARTGQETAALGVIGCVRAGFELVGRNLWLLAFPIALDLLLWLGPRLSISPLLQTLIAFFKVQFGSDPSVVPQVSQLGNLLEQLGQRFNLMSLLSGLPLFTIPSLLSGLATEAISPLGDARVHMMTGLFSSFLWAAGLLCLGLILGILFLNSLARRVVAMRPIPKPSLSPQEDAGEGPGSGEESHFIRLVRVFLFVGGVLVIVACLLPVWALVFGMAAVIAPLLGVAVWVLSVGLVGYLCLHLLFVVHSVLLGGRGLIRAIWESVVLIHAQLPSVAGLVALIVIIHQGLGQVWALPSSDSWLLLVGILGNACIATGLTAATFVFYEQRIPKVLETIRRRRQLRRT